MYNCIRKKKKINSFFDSTKKIRKRYNIHSLRCSLRLEEFNWSISLVIPRTYWIAQGISRKRKQDRHNKMWTRRKGKINIQRKGYWDYWTSVGGKNGRRDTKVKKIEREGRKRWEECKKELKNIQEAMKILKKHSRKLDFLFHKRKSANKRCLKMDCSKEFPQQQKKSYKGLNP